MNASPMAPVQASERIEFLDVLRGAALFGIITANMRGFNGPLAAYFDRQLMWTGAVDRIAQGFIDVFVSGKFITLFSFLFGIGFAIQMHRASDRAVDPKKFYRRRLTVLLCFGLLHSIFIWWGDILMPYALMGFCLFALRNRSDKAILRWAAVLYVWPLCPIVIGAALATLGVPVPPMPATTQEELQRTIQIYSSGTYLQILQQNLKVFAFNIVGLVLFYPRVLAIFLAGMWVYRRGILTNLSQHTDLLKRCRKHGLAVGLAGNLAFVVLSEILKPDPHRFDWNAALVNTVASVAIPALSLGYASTLALLFMRDTWRARLAPFGAVGRTALTNYLLQSVICTTLYYSWGFRLYGRVDPLTGLVPTVLIYAAQLAASVWYVRRFAYGPMEWLWRRLTYGSLRRLAAATATGSTP